MHSPPRVHLISSSPVGHDRTTHLLIRADNSHATDTVIPLQGAEYVCHATLRLDVGTDSTSSPSTSAMAAFAPYVTSLEALTHEVLGQGAFGAQDRLLAALDGQPQQELRARVAATIRKQHGAFFTGSTLSSAALSHIPRRELKLAIILDPACGAGDLLVACAKQLDVRATLDETLLAWTTQLHGFDLHQEFIRAAKLRIILTALLRGARPTGDIRIDEVLTNVRIGDGLKEEHPSATHILTNPPFHYLSTPTECTWTSGIVSAAAVFFERWTRATARTRIIGILPDVLRSGARYRQWRELIERRCSIVECKPYGAFDSVVDIDVFILHAARGKTPTPFVWTTNTRAGRTIADAFTVTVGPVVPHRDPHLGQWHPYVDTRSLPPWEQLTSVRTRRRWQGRLARPPFVAIRRTSAPRDKFRAVASIVSGREAVAVENHLIICMPLSRTVKACKQLLDYLQTPAVNSLINDAIRCRHLRTSTIGDLPWPYDD
jgi:hypothetical protein